MFESYIVLVIAMGALPLGLMGGHVNHLNNFDWIPANFG